MALFKCKMCGGELDISNETVAICKYCGTQQTLPKLEDDRRANLYDRANHFRRNNEFDKAMSIYEKILNEDTGDAEAYWSLVLCRFGIEYVEDPATHKRIPTINRAQYTSVFDDDNYKSALTYADSYQKTVYENEAKAINEIQKGILAISQQEEPFDVFICYKETDNNGRRTRDSVLANDLYHQLTQEGFKVFFARITLEDKLGSAYEPYIFAALNSAKVMVVLGTKPEFFKAVWVRNEWSRYLSLIKQGQNKILIPAYKDMDPYDLPEEFSHLQAQDMSKLGFMQDLIRGIKKITQVDMPPVTVAQETVVIGGNASVAPLLKRAFMFLEDADWAAADEYCEKVLDLDPENAMAYLGKLLAELRLRKQENLRECKEFIKSNNFQKTMRFADETLKATLNVYVENIESARKDEVLAQADTKLAIHRYREALNLLETISGWKDADEKAQKCRDTIRAIEEKEIEAKKNKILAEGKAKMTSDLIIQQEAAIKLFKSIPGWKNADELVETCRKNIEAIEEHEAIAAMKEIRSKKIKRMLVVATSAFIVLFGALMILFSTVILPAVRENREYKQAESLLEQGDIIGAYEAFSNMDGIKDSEKRAAMLYDSYITEQMKRLKPGDYFVFGMYEQDDNIDNGRESVEWLVLAVEDEKMLVISRYALDCKPYNEEYTYITWENSTIRKWLNGNFIKNTFSASERALITTSTISTNNQNGTLSSQKDQVFLLSETEVERYFGSVNARTCKATDYAIAKGVVRSNLNDNCWWWLRSDESIYADGVKSDGNIGNEYFVNVETIAVRPAMWISME